MVARRRVPLPPIDPVTARNLLIEHGLVEQGLPTTAHFVRHNRALRESIASLAAKTRRRDLVVDDYLVAGFYQAQLPADVCDRGRLEKFARSITAPPWAKQLHTAAGVSQWLAVAAQRRGDQPTCYMRPEDLIQTASEADHRGAFSRRAGGGQFTIATGVPLRAGLGSRRHQCHEFINLRSHKSATIDSVGWYRGCCTKTRRDDQVVAETDSSQLGAGRRCGPATCRTVATAVRHRAIHVGRLRSDVAAAEMPITATISNRRSWMIICNSWSTSSTTKAKRSPRSRSRTDSQTLGNSSVAGRQPG